MTDLTPNLLLPYILAAQAQKHVTHNEAIRALDCLVQLEVADRHLTAPPAAPADGTRYIVAAGATGAWSGEDGSIAAFQDGAWTFYPPREGWRAWLAAEKVGCVYTSAIWQIDSGSGSGTSASLWTGKAWTAIGDSITQQAYYTTPLATLLGATLTNIGQSGTSLSTSSSGSGDMHAQVASITSGVDLITIMGGINDFYRPSTLGALGDTTSATIYGAVTRFCVDILTAHPAAILVWITPYDTTASQNNTANAGGVTLAQIVQAIKDVAGRYGCAVIDAHGESGISGYTAAQYMADGLHVNATGGTRLAQFIADRLARVRPATTAIPQAAIPTFSPAAGSYSSTQSVTIACATSGAVIHVTTDGSTPTSASPVYSSAVSVAASETLSAIAIASGLTNSAVGTAAYTISAGTVATPTFTPAAGSYTGTQSVTIACATSGAVIHVTTDGSAPTSASPVYSGAISVAATETLKAIAIASGYTNSAIATAAYTISTGFNPASLSPLAWLDFADLSTLFTNTAHTTAVAADGNAIAYQVNKGTGGKDVAQASTGARPIWRTDGTHSWAEWDGNKLLPFADASTLALAGGNWTLAWTSRKADTSGTGSVIMGAGDDWFGDNVVAIANPALKASGTIVSGAAGAASAVSDHVTMAVVSGGSAQFYHNGAASGAAVTGITGISVNGLIFSPPYMYAGRIYQVLLFNRALASGEVASLTTWIGAKAGLVL